MITAFLPCRKGSQRIKDKNIRPFAGIDGGLLEIKLHQLIKTNSIDAVIVSSNDERVLEFVKRYKSEKIIIDERPDHLGSSKTTTDELIKYVPSLISEGHILWTHVTSPFLDETDYETLIKKYLTCLDSGYDSLMTVLRLQGFIWDENGPISYNKSQLKWPMTQSIKPMYEIDSGLFISPSEGYSKYEDRIGVRPFLAEQEKIKSIDIDWPDDFEFAQHLWRQKKE